MEGSLKMNESSSKGPPPLVDPITGKDNWIKTSPDSVEWPDFESDEFNHVLRPAFERYVETTAREKPGLAFSLLIVEVNTLLMILKVPIRISLVTV
jgi:hypothetical protein